MNLLHIELENLKIAPLNVRKKGAKQVDDLVPSIRALGVLQPLLVRQNCEGYEVVAGQRRYYALQKLDKTNPVDPVPCIVMEDTEDAAAVEASLAENLARLPMDEIDQYKAFVVMVKKGMSAEDVAAHFGITERLVHQRMAIGNLITPILNAYRKDEIEPSTLRILTMATKAQQKQWYELYKEHGAYRVPRGHQLKQWLFGGSSIPTENALFDLAEYTGVITADLFGEDSYFADSALFWELQNTAIANAQETYLANGWSEVIILDKGEHFYSYEYEDTTKKKGGKVYIQIAGDGNVTFYEGQLHRKEVQKRLNEGSEKPITARPEISQPMQNYLDLHRHGAVRTELLNHEGVALRLAVAQMIAGSELWNIYAEAQHTKSDAISASLESSASQQAFAKTRKAICGILGMKEGENDTLVNRKEDWGNAHDLHEVFTKLLALDDKAVLKVLTFVVAETLPCGSKLVEALGHKFSVDMGQSWTPDDTFFALLRDKEAVNAMLKHVGGKAAADAHITETAKKQKSCIQEKLTQEKAKGWLPHYMQFPMKAYTKRGGISAIDHWKAVKKHYC